MSKKQLTAYRQPQLLDGEQPMPTALYPVSDPEEIKFLGSLRADEWVDAIGTLPEDNFSDTGIRARAITQVALENDRAFREEARVLTDDFMTFEIIFVAAFVREAHGENGRALKTLYEQRNHIRIVDVNLVAERGA